MLEFDSFLPHIGFQLLKSSWSSLTYFFCLIMRQMSSIVELSGLQTKGIQQRLSSLSLTHRDFSIFSESFDDVMLCR